MTDLHWKITVMQNTVPCIDTTVIASNVIRRQANDAVHSILRTSINMESLVRVHAAANIS